MNLKKTNSLKVLLWVVLWKVLAKSSNSLYRENKICNKGKLNFLKNKPCIFECNEVEYYWKNNSVNCV